MSTTKICLSLVSLLFIAGCSGAGGTSAATASNAFTSAGSDLTMDKITSAASGSSVSSLATSQLYYGRVLYKSGGNTYAAAIHFTLNQDTVSTAYFTNFFLDRLVQVSAVTASSPIVTTSTDMVVSSSYNASLNGLSIAGASSRFVRFSLDFGNNTYFADIVNAGVIFSRDASTMVGGNNASFFFIAQKAASLPSASLTDLSSTWSLANFLVNTSGVISVTSTSSVGIAGVGGHGLTSFKGTNSVSGAFEGEVALNGASAGIFILGFDSTPGNGIPTHDGFVDGAFLLSPDKNYLLGYNTLNAVYFAASR